MFVTLPLLSAALALWVAVVITRPREPVPGNEAAELVYSRLLGNRDSLQIFAVLMSYAAFFAAVLTVAAHA